MLPNLSVVVPVYNEEEVLPLLVERLKPALDAINTSYEVVFVDDGSADQSPALLQRIAREWENARIIRLRANAGHQAAITAGLARSRGEWVATIDADLQDPPEVIGEMLETALREKVDVVYGVRTDRSTDTYFKRTTAEGFYRLMARMGAKGAMNAGDFRLISRATVEAVLALPEHGRVLRLVIPALGFPSAEVGYKREVRAAGDSKYPLSKMLKLTLDAVTGLSHAPLRLATWMAGIGFVVAFGVGIYALVAKATGDPSSGWASTVCIMAALAALQLLCLGILGEYVGRMYLAMQARPSHYVAYDSLEQPLPRGDERQDEPQPAPHSSTPLAP
ncbi:glycosyltransferase family 2 protein [Falsarthrobacter nasiphocae]|uniref:Dolichol-phosphate mannosyltransferase n=1 Tax=Falsarthrobacter nasiphocae TaxID=189863 RepID=A0AAE3YF05_9MICC|nr:glycosyltransferase family 2 protein [Falsarthrobacter nasiphocae]MDR6892020.1 dolichol-phosphate mannosyltransferase [Falsarthrobacter nasiphocae]